MSLIPCPTLPARRFATIAACAVSVFALAAPSPAPGAEQTQAPAVRHQGDIAYVSGGIGDDEARALRAMASRFNVHLEFYNEANGEALSDVTLVVTDGEGKRLLRAVTTGPLLFIRMPAGRYSAHATYQGVTRSHDFRAQAAPVKHVFRLPVNELEDDWLLCNPQCPTGR